MLPRVVAGGTPTQASHEALQAPPAITWWRGMSADCCRQHGIEAGIGLGSKLHAVALAGGSWRQDGLANPPHPAGGCPTSGGPTRKGGTAHTCGIHSSSVALRCCWGLTLLRVRRRLHTTPCRVQAGLQQRPRASTVQSLDAWAIFNGANTVWPDLCVGLS